MSHPNAKYSTVQNLMSYISKSNDCWVWIGKRDKLGYGQAGRQGHAHRVVYTALVGKIPKGLSLDHLCRNPSCVNPSHLEPVTHRENVLRGIGPTAENAKKTICKWGHRLTGNNVRIKKTGRECVACQNRRNKEYALRQQIREVSRA